MKHVNVFNKTTTAGVYGENRTCTCDKVQEEGLSGMYSNKGRKMLKRFFETVMVKIIAIAICKYSKLFHK